MMARVENSEARESWVAAVGACGAVGFVVFQCFGNATRGYIDSPSMFWWWVSQWLNPRAETEHGWLILAIAGWVFWRNGRKAESGELRAEGGELRAESPELRVQSSQGKVRSGSFGDRALSSGLSALSSSGRPVAAMILGLALHAVGFVAQQTRVSIVAFLIFAWGVVALANRRWAQAAAFPLGFMVFAIPVNALDSVGFWLRLWVIDVAEAFSRVAHLGLVRNGTQLLAPDGRYQYDVAAACSGVRSLMALAALSLLIGYLNFRSWPRRAAMLALCLPLTYVGNVARILAIVVAAQAGGQAWGGRVHDVMGFGVFVIVLGGALAAARGIERWWPEQFHVIRETAAGEARCGRWEFHVIRETMVGVAVVGLAVGEMVFLAQVARRPGDAAAGVRLAADGKNPVELPAFVGTEWIGRRAEVTAVEREILPADTGFSRRNYVDVQDGTHAVFVSVVLSGRDRTSIHRPELCLVGQGWTIAGTGAHRFAFARGGEGSAIPATLLRTERTAGGRKIRAVVAYWFLNSEVTVATHWERFFHDAWDRVRHGRADRWAYVLVQADADDGEAAALARMQAVLDGTVPALVARGRD